MAMVTARDLRDRAVYLNVISDVEPPIRAMLSDT